MTHWNDVSMVDCDIKGEGREQWFDCELTIYEDGREYTEKAKASGFDFDGNIRRVSTEFDVNNPMDYFAASLNQVSCHQEGSKAFEKRNKISCGK